MREFVSMRHTDNNIYVKEEWGKKIQRFSRFKRQYLENGSRYGQSYY